MYKTEQEKFWAGEFGNEYIERNAGSKLLAGNLHLFSEIMEKTREVKSVIEFGSNIGMNLKAIAALKPEVKDISAIEINSRAAEIIKEESYIKNVYEQSILDFTTDYKRDFVLIKGVLIHINPDELEIVYSKLYETSSKYICVVEYYNPTPIEIQYRGNSGKLYKRDFAGEMMNNYSDLKLVDYGFVYRKDPNYPQDDITWFLLEKERYLCEV